MGFRFRKTITIFKGFKVNIGKKGITSVTVGPRGATTSIGKRGTFQTLSIPGTGLSHRRALYVPQKETLVVEEQERILTAGEQDELDLLFGVFTILFKDALTYIVEFDKGEDCPEEAKKNHAVNGKLMMFIAMKLQRLGLDKAEIKNFIEKSLTGPASETRDSLIQSYMGFIDYGYTQAEIDYDIGKRALLVIKDKV